MKDDEPWTFEDVHDCLMTSVKVLDYFLCEHNGC